MNEWPGILQLLPKMISTNSQIFHLMKCLPFDFKSLRGTSMNDPANPRARASVLSISFFGWMNNVLKLGNKKSLGDQDLFPFLEDQKAELLVSRAERCWLSELRKSQLQTKKPRLWRAAIALIPWKSVIKKLILQMLTSLSYVLLPLSLWFVMKALSDGSELDTNVAFISVTLLGAMSVVPALATQQYNHLTELWGLKLKVVLIGLVYKKVRPFPW